MSRKPLVGPPYLLRLALEILCQEREVKPTPSLETLELCVEILTEPNLAQEIRNFLARR